MEMATLHRQGDGAGDALGKRRRGRDRLRKGADCAGPTGNGGAELSLLAGTTIEPFA
ncbi:hypothetical protein Droror1_Dr00023027, partial [Drosera rotundifolia]